MFIIKLIRYVCKTLIRHKRYFQAVRWWFVVNGCELSVLGNGWLTIIDFSEIHTIDRQLNFSFTHSVTHNFFTLEKNRRYRSMLSQAMRTPVCVPIVTSSLPRRSLWVYFCRAFVYPVFRLLIFPTTTFPIDVQFYFGRDPNDTRSRKCRVRKAAFSFAVFRFYVNDVSVEYVKKL